ncbi:hypothetical protein COE50_22335 [Bacillus anthracis]|nr:hypothetical protein COE50_22335 [Bacillus anthracis]
MTTTKLNRAELLQMALDGKVTRGDKFKDERGDIITFDGTEFVWGTSGNTLKLMVHNREHFTPVFVDKEVTITLKQSEINDLALTLGRSVYSMIRDEASRRGIEIPSGTAHTALYNKFDELRK